MLGWVAINALRRSCQRLAAAVCMLCGLMTVTDSAMHHITCKCQLSIRAQAL